MERTIPAVLVTSPRFWTAENWGMKLLRENGFEPIYSPDFDVPAPSRHRVQAIVLGADRVCTAERMAMFPNLKVIARTGTGYDNVAMDTARKRGIVVTRVSDLNADVVSELILGLVLALTRNIFFSYNAFVHDEQWNQARKPGRSLPELTVGIVGLGSMGRALAAKLARLNAKEILGWNRTARKEVTDAANEHRMRIVDLDTLMTHSDVVVVCLALQQGEGGTEGIVSRERLERMRDGALLVNASRGEVIDEEALADKVISGKIGGLALDVYSEEPPFQRPFYKKLKGAAGRANIVLTPHMGAVTQDVDKNMSLAVAQNIIRAMDNQLDGLEIVS